MTQRTAVLEKSLSHVDVINAETAISTRRLDAGRSVFATLIARLFASADPVRIVAFTSAEPRAGVSYTVHRLALEMTKLTGQTVEILHAAELRDWSADERNQGIRSYRPAERLAKLRDRAGFVLIDAGSLAAGADAIRLASMVDGVVLVVEAGRTTNSEITRAAGSIGDAQGKLLGIVLNKRKYPVPHWLYRLFR